MRLANPSRVRRTRPVELQRDLGSPFPCNFPALKSILAQHPDAVTEPDQVISARGRIQCLLLVLGVGGCQVRPDDRADGPASARCAQTTINTALTPYRISTKAKQRRRQKSIVHLHGFQVVQHTDC